MLTDISSQISREKLYIGGKSHRLMSYLMQLNISRDHNSEQRQQDKNKESQILKHKSVENLHTEIFHDDITSNYFF